MLSRPLIVLVDTRWNDLCILKLSRTWIRTSRPFKSIISRLFYHIFRTLISKIATLNPPLILVYYSFFLHFILYVHSCTRLSCFILARSFFTTRAVFTSRVKSSVIVLIEPSIMHRSSVQGSEKNKLVFKKEK